MRRKQGQGTILVLRWRSGGRRVGRPGLQGMSWAGRCAVGTVPSPGVCRKRGPGTGSGNHFRFGMARGRRVGGPGLKGTSWTGRDLDRVPSPGVWMKQGQGTISVLGCRAGERRVGGPGLQGMSWVGRDVGRVPSPGVCRRYRPSRVSSHHGSRLRSRTAQIKTSVSSNV